MIDEKQIEYAKSMDPEQLEFNKRMLSFYEFIGVSPSEVAKMELVLRTYEDSMTQANANFKAMREEIDDLRKKVTELENEMRGGSSKKAKKTVFEDLSEPALGVRNGY